MEFELDEDGNVRSIYTDEAAQFLERSGATVKKIERASHVEWEANGWTVRAAKNTDLAIREVDGELVVSESGPLKYFKQRDEAIQAEIKHVWELI